MGEKVQQVLRESAARRMREELAELGLEVSGEQVLRLAPDDILVLCTPNMISTDEAKAISHHVHTATGHSRILVLGDAFAPTVIQASQDPAELKDLLAGILTTQRLILELLGPDTEEEEEPPATDLDGNPAGGERDQSQSLG